MGEPETEQDHRARHHANDIFHFHDPILSLYRHKATFFREIVPLVFLARPA
jgi:hypothetical protein